MRYVVLYIFHVSMIKYMQGVCKGYEFYTWTRTAFRIIGNKLVLYAAKSL